MDVLSGPEIGISLFYLLPIAAIAYRLRRRAATIVAVCASGVWLWADHLTQPALDATISIWNAATRLVIYVAMGLLIATVRRDRAELARLLARETELARTDALTGLLNQRGFRELIAREIERSRASAEPLCLAFVDVDNFKRINDELGHAEGDAFLRRIAGALSDTLRTSDHAARLGGDEFAVLFWNARADQVDALAKRLASAVTTAAERYRAQGVGASVGVAHFRVPPETADAALQRADQAMHEGKNQGKGRVVVVRA